MKVLVVTNHLVPGQLDLWEEAALIDGIELHLAGAAPTRQLDPYITGERAESGLEHYLQPLPLRKGRDSTWWYFKGLRSKLRELRPDVLHVHCEAWGVPAIQSLAMASCPVVIHGADNQFYFGHGLERTVRDKLLGFTLHRAAAYVSWNAEGSRLALSCNPQLPTCVVPGIATPDPVSAGLSRRAEIPTVPQHDVSKLRLGFVGRDAPEKGLDVLINALTLVAPTTRHRLELVLAGANRQAGEIETLTGVSAKSLGEMPQPDALELIGTLDALIVPSVSTPRLREQYGRVAVEAMARSVPVIYSRSGALPEVVDYDKLAFDEGESSQLAAILERSAQDRSILIEAQAAVRNQYELHHSPRELARKLVDLWKSVANGG
ncbi:glycosyltransferase family 4 protein [Actinomycetospora sp. CA-084318]|uniref:glycosyltransferase family 4 protein n=1 Tax=Actinomycetospora sp. CA-084318 TaxID=3239892 RepID=UPI003D99D30D